VGLSEMQFGLYESLLKQNGVITNSKTSGKVLNNLLMQLRKVCNHPYLFEGVEEDGADEYGEHIVTNSGKLKFVSKLLEKALTQKD
jgi:SNF2 family DNA or RNA helicase